MKQLRLFEDTKEDAAQIKAHWTKLCSDTKSRPEDVKMMHKNMDELVAILTKHGIF
jgi:hypothetical protein